MRRAIVGAELAVIILIGVGFGWIQGLAVGDAQWQKYTNAGVCDSRHMIVTYVPKFVNDKGIERIKFSTPCDQWPKPK